jgi:hypothetical protein
MSNIIFKKDISDNILYDFLHIYCEIENNYYILNDLTYKKYKYNDLIIPLLNNLKEYYKKSKVYYLEREISYNNLLTIIRQISRFKDIYYYNKIKYNSNKYNIVYYIKINN